MDPRVRRIIAFIEKDLQREMRLDEIAREFNLSASRLRHMFKDSIGITPAQYLKSRRLEKAKQLLGTTFLNIKQIMRDVGIKERSHFMRDFKEIYGLAPTQYRTHCLKREEPDQSHAVQRKASLRSAAKSAAK